jgi:hypothetical protein
MIDTVPFMDVGPNMVGIRQFDSSLVGIKEGPIWYRTGDENFISSVTLRSYNINFLYGS